MGHSRTQTLLLATHNAGKVRELASDISAYGLNIKSFGDFDIPAPLEDGGSFEANAMIKAVAGHNATGLPCLADDSGLEVEFLHGAPGVETSSYGGWEKLLNVMSDLPADKRKARFVCVLTLVRKDHPPLVWKGFSEGFIALQAQGDHGFGYDPVFIPSFCSSTFAQMTKEEKSKYSHRGAALSAFLKWLQRQEGRLA